MNCRPVYALSMFLVFSLFVSLNSNLTSILKSDSTSDVQDLADRADYVVIGQVTSVTSSWNEDGTLIYSYVGVSVERYLKGASQANEIVIRILGGEVGDVGFGVSSEPRFVEGEKVKAFLRLENDYFAVVGEQRGKVSLDGFKVASGGFSYSGIHWDEADIPVEYYISETVPSSWIPAVRQAFQTWEDVLGIYMDYTYMGTTPIGPPATNDYLNVVSHGYIDGLGGTLARCTYWYNTQTLLLSEADIVFDDAETWSTTGATGAYDVQNVGTHEAGHSLILNDLTHYTESEQTMFYSTVTGETKKRTLEAGDVAGIRHIYGYKWPMFRHDVAHTGYSLSVAPVTNTILWIEPTLGRVHSSPAVSKGMVFIGSCDNHVYALNEINGSQVWFHPTGGEVWSSPVVEKNVFIESEYLDVVFVGSDDNRVYALDAADGSPIWSFLTGGQVRSSPVVADGRVYVGSLDGLLYCLDAASGSQIWNHTALFGIASSPAVADGMVFFGSYDSNVYAVDATNGAPAWTFPTLSTVDSSPAVADGMVFIGSNDANLYALNEFSGGKLWNFTAKDDVVSSPAVADGMVFFGSGTMVYALDKVNGVKLWNFTTGGPWVISSPAVADGMVFVGSADGKIYSLDEYTGQLVWSYTTGDWVMSSPAVADGIVFVGSYDDNVYAFSPSEVRDIAITDLTLEKTVVAQESEMDVNVTVANEGLSTEIFNVTTYYNATIFSEGFESESFAGWDFSYSTNGVQSGSVPAGTWSSSIVSGADALSGMHSARLFADSDASVAPWWVDAAINRTMSRDDATLLKATFRFDSITDPGSAAGRAAFYITVINTLETSESVSYGFDNSTSLSPGDVSFNVSPGDLIMFEADIATDFFNKYGKTLPDEIMIRFQASADYAEPSPGRQTVEVRLDDIAVASPSATLGMETVTLTSGNSTTVTFTWNTLGVPYGNYTITSVVDAVLGETDTSDNVLVDGWVLVTIPGDVNGDKTVNILDAGKLNAHWTPVGRPYDVNADINNDGSVNILDAGIVSAHWFESW